MYMILMLLIQELPYLYFLVIFLFFLVRLFYNATSTDAYLPFGERSFLRKLSYH